MPKYYLLNIQKCLKKSRRKIRRNAKWFMKRRNWKWIDLYKCWAFYDNDFIALRQLHKIENNLKIFLKILLKTFTKFIFCQTNSNVRHLRCLLICRTRAVKNITHSSFSFTNDKGEVRKCMFVVGL